jgi:hypothetical protein
MTTRELRQQLSEVADQEMTVRELREVLFGMCQDIPMNQKGFKEMNFRWKHKKEERDRRAEHYKLFEEGNLP